MAICNERGVFNVCLFVWMEHWLADSVRGVPGARTNPPGSGQGPSIPSPSLNVGSLAEHIWSRGWSHISALVYNQPLDTIHSVAEHRATPHTPKTVSGHTSRVSCQGCHPPPSPPRTQQPPTLRPHITSPHPSSERLEKWEMFSQQPSHYHRSLPSS